MPKGYDMFLRFAVAIDVDGDMVIVARLDKSDRFARCVVFYRNDRFETGKSTHGTNEVSACRIDRCGKGFLGVAAVFIEPLL